MVTNEPIKLYELLSLTVSAAGFVIVLITVRLLLRQTREMATQTKHVAESLRIDASTSVASQVFAVDHIFIECPELRPYFYSDKEIDVDNPMYNQAAAVAELLLDSFEAILLQMDKFPYVVVCSRKTWEEYVIDSFAASPLLRKRLLQDPNWWPEEILKMEQQGEARRQSKDNTKAVVPIFA